MNEKVKEICWHVDCEDIDTIKSICDYIDSRDGLAIEYGIVKSRCGAVWKMDIYGYGPVDEIDYFEEFIIREKLKISRNLWYKEAWSLGRNSPLDFLYLISQNLQVILWRGKPYYNKRRDRYE